MPVSATVGAAKNMILLCCRIVEILVATRRYLSLTRTVKNHVLSARKGRSPRVIEPHATAKQRQCQCEVKDNGRIEGTCHAVSQVIVL